MKIKNYLIWPGVALGVGGISYLLSRKGMEQTYPLLEKSVLTPHPFTFSVDQSYAPISADMQNKNR